MPSGLHINQKYVVLDEIRAKPFAFTKNTYVLKIPNKNKINHKKQLRSLMPNLIHSLDAVSIALLVKLLTNYGLKEYNFFSVHDCFAVTMNNVEELKSFIFLVYINLYLKDQYLLKFDQGLINHIKNNYGENCFDPYTKKITIENIKSPIDYPDINVVLLGEIETIDVLNSKNIII